ncbi:hypothetical protein NECAME_03609, partial [Necator americanus]
MSLTSIFSVFGCISRQFYTVNAVIMWTGGALEKYVRDLSCYIKSCLDGPEPIEQKSTDNIQ